MPLIALDLKSGGIEFCGSGSVKQNMYHRADDRNTISTEARLVLDCCRLAGSGAAMEGLSGVELDWSKVLELACKERVLPLVSEALARQALDARPTIGMGEMRRRLHAHACNAILLSREVAALLAALGREGIRALTFKGPALAVAAYGRISLRMFDDVDVLVDDSDYARCCTFMGDRGYIVLRDFGFERTLRREGASVTVDLHRSISSAAFPCALSFDELWTRRRRLQVAGSDVDTLSTGDHLMVLCVQITRDCWECKGSLAKLCDVARLVGDVSIDWGAALRRAGELGFERRLLAVLAAAQSLLGAPLPQPVGLRLDQHRSARRLGEFICREFLRSAEGGLGQLAARIAFHFFVHERTRHKLAQLRMVPVKLKEAWIACS